MYFSPSAGEAEETSPDIVNEDAMECKISSNSYKLTFVEGGQSTLYKKKSLPKARLVSKAFVKRGRRVDESLASKSLRESPLNSHQYMYVVLVT